MWTKVLHIDFPVIGPCRRKLADSLDAREPEPLCTVKCGSGYEKKSHWEQARSIRIGWIASRVQEAD
jgi:hypothetical protein